MPAPYTDLLNETIDDVAATLTAVNVAATSSMVSFNRSVYGAGIRQPLVEGCPTIA